MKHTLHDILIAIYSYHLDNDEVQLYRSTSLRWLHSLYDNICKLQEDIFELRNSEAQKDIVLFHKFWFCINAMKKIIGQKTLALSQYSSHMELASVIHNFKELFGDRNMFPVKGTLFTIYLVWSPFVCSSLWYIGSTIRSLCTRTKEHIRNWILKTQYLPHYPIIRQPGPRNWIVTPIAFMNPTTMSMLQHYLL